MSESPSQESLAYARTIPCHKISLWAPFRWLFLAIRDFVRAPLISLAYGILFSFIPLTIMYFVALSGSHLVILPATVALAIIGPVFAVGLYDVAWELEKGHTPTIRHSLKSMFRNPTGEWGFAIILMVVMIAWMRIAALVHALYPNSAEPTYEELSTFLAIGSIIGAMMLAVVFSVSAFTPQIMMERRVDLMTAIFTSFNAVNSNVAAIALWGCIILALVLIGFFSYAIGFVFIMPILSYASWHAYIAVITTKKEREYE